MQPAPTQQQPPAAAQQPAATPAAPTSPATEIVPASCTRIVDFIKFQKQSADAVNEEKNVPHGYQEAEHDRLTRERGEAPKPTHVIDDDDMHIWSGFVTRNKQHRVCVDAYTVMGDNNDQFLTD